MTTLAFDGIDDNVQSSNDPGTALDGAISVFALLRRDGAPASTYETIFHGANSGGGFGWFLAFEYDPGTGTHRISTWDNNVNRYSTTALDEANRDWWIVGLTKASGAVVPRFHMKNLTTDGAWTHEDGAGTTSFESISGGSVMWGNATASGLVYDFLGLMAVGGVWDAALTDAEVEELSANSQTSDWWGNSGGQPVSLTELTSATPTDLAAFFTWSPSGVVTSASDPPGWTFDGQGGGVVVSGAFGFSAVGDLAVSAARTRNARLDAEAAGQLTAQAKRTRAAGLNAAATADLTARAVALYAAALSLSAEGNMVAAGVLQTQAVAAILRVLARADTTLTLSAQEETALDLTATPETVLRVYG